jgi:hypothetical protein
MFLLDETQTRRKSKMTRILFVGLEPETVDFSDPALPPGFNAEKIHAGIAVGMRQMTERGWQADLCLIRPDGTAAAAGRGAACSQVL